MPLSPITDARTPHVIFFLLLLPSSIAEQHPPPAVARGQGARGLGGGEQQQHGGARPGLCMEHATRMELAAGELATQTDVLLLLARVAV
jgi:hypothetical protein